MNDIIKEVMNDATQSPSSFDKELEYVENDNGCWIYALKSRDRNGYSVIKHQGRNWYGHVFNYVKFNGPISAGMEVRHSKKCSRDCINPEHLSIGTHKENMQDIKEHKKEICKAGHELNRQNSFRFNNNLHCKICRALKRVSDA